jgi:virginiamycin B lyase
MTVNRWTVLFAGIATVAGVVGLKIPGVVGAQDAAQGVYWKADDLKTTFNLPRVSSATQPESRPRQELFPNPYEELSHTLRVPNNLLAENWSGPGWAHVAFDSHGNIWTLDRADPPLVQFDRSGKFIKAIGHGLPFVGVHFLHIDKDDNLWVSDNMARPGKGNQVTKLSPDGKVLLTLGKPGVKGGSPENFMGPVGIVTAPNGDIFVTDGHFTEPDGGGRNMAGEFFNWDAGTREVTHSRVAKFSKDGKFIKQWGRTGSGPGEFYVPHGIAMDSQGRIFVADRGNNRLQIFDQEGKLLDIWTQFGKPCDVSIDANDTIYVVDSDSNSNLKTWKYSTLGKASELFQVPRLVDVGSPNPDFTQGIRIGSAKDGIVRAFIPPHIGPEGPLSIPERSRADANGNLYASEGRTNELKVYVKKMELPQGTGAEIVQKGCISCHDVRDFTRMNFDRQGWQTVVDTMVAGGAPLNKEEIPVAVDYLAANFRGTAPGVLVPGKVQASFEGWDLPTANSLPHDIINTRTGVWYTGRFSNVMGRFDPQTKQFEEFRLRPDTHPVTLTEVQGGNARGTIFFTSETGGMIGEFHPMVGYMGYWGKGDVVVHPVPVGGPDLLPHPRFRLHDLAPGEGGHWFTVPKARAPFEEGGKIGVAHNLSFEVRLIDLPTHGADPGGLVINSKGIPFFADRNTPRLGSINPRTMAVTDYLLPDAAGAVSSLTTGTDGMVWYTDYRRGYLGRFDPKTAKFTEWPSPSGSRSLPDGIARVGNIIWYAESGTNPNMLVRFDPKTEKFQTWEVKAGGGVKNLYADTDGSLWFTRPLANGIGHVTVKEP